MFERETHLESNLQGPGYAVFVRLIDPRIPLGSVQAVVAFADEHGNITKTGRLEDFCLTREQVQADVRYLFDNCSL